MEGRTSSVITVPTGIVHLTKSKIYENWTVLLNLSQAIYFGRMFQMAKTTFLKLSLAFLNVRLRNI